MEGVSKELDDVVLMTAMKLAHNYVISSNDGERASTDATAKDFASLLPLHPREAFLTLYELTKHDKVRYDEWELLLRERVLRNY